MYSFLRLYLTAVENLRSLALSRLPKLLTMQVYAKAKECAEQLSAEDFAILLAKHFTSYYRQVKVDNFVLLDFTIWNIELEFIAIVLCF